jgi:anaerobic magnesium-protoporphyrin IX monomethyl ester cyclase
MMMVSSRGCPWSCNFCRRPVGKMLTVRSAEKIYEEMKMLSETYGIKDIAFQDDVFTVNHENVIRLCDLLIEKPIDVRWLCFARVDIVTPELLVKMKEAGCWQVMFGIENFEQSILDGINKGIQVEQIFSAIQWTKDANIEVRICMIVGNMGDTTEIIEKNIQLVKKLSPDYLSVAILTPFPGHDIYNWGLKEGRIMTLDWDLYYGSVPILKLDTLSPNEVVTLFRKMTFSVYFDPRFILKKILSIRTFTEFFNYAKGFLGLFHFLLEKLIFKIKTPRKVDRTAKKAYDYGDVMSEEKIKKTIALTSTATAQTAKT